MFEAAELQWILDAATMPLKALMPLGINCGFGNGDVAGLECSTVDFGQGYVNFPRPKTGIDRRCPLWPETVDAVKQAARERPEPKFPDAAKRFFVTRCGSPWGSVRLVEKEEGKIVTITDDPVAKEFIKLIKSLGLHREGLGFYALRRTCETIGGGSRDQVAVNAIMGHADTSMAGVYRERIDDDRLVAVADHVHDWLFGAKKVQPRAAKRTAASKKPRKAAKTVGTIA